jgi:hypothetical protein
MKLWAFEFCSCIYESDYGLESLHTSESNAKRACKNHIRRIKRQHKNMMKEMNLPENYIDPLAHTATRIREVTVKD